MTEEQKEQTQLLNAQRKAQRAQALSAKQIRRLERRKGMPPAYLRARTWLRLNIRIGGPRYDEEFVDKVRRSLH